MFKKIILAVLLTLPLLGAASAAPLKVVTTTADLASVVKEIGKERVEVQNLAQGRQNPHFVDAKPSFIVKLMKADLFIETGLELEAGWAPLLIQSSGNRKIQKGAEGYLDASIAISPLEVPQGVSRAMGDVHPMGNPHYMMDPENGRLVARRIQEKLAALAPPDSQFFEANLKQFEVTLDRYLKEWSGLIAPYKSTPYVGYHRDHVYFAQRFELIPFGEIEPKPGIPPTAAHTAKLIAAMKEKKVPLLLTDPWYETRTALSISKQTGADVVLMSIFPGGIPETKDYFSAIDYNVRKIADALAKRSPKNQP